MLFRSAPQQLVTGNRRANPSFNMIHNQIRTRKVAHKRLHLGIVHRIGHIPAENHTLAILGHLPQSKRASQDTHIRMHADQNNIFDTLMDLV